MGDGHIVRERSDWRDWVILIMWSSDCGCLGGGGGGGGMTAKKAIKANRFSEFFIRLAFFPLF